MQRSETIGGLIAALAKAQAEFTFAAKESKNPAFGSSYADLASVISAVRPVLSKNGIAFLQCDESDVTRQTASVTTSLHHGEEWISVTAEAPATGLKGFNVQSIGSAWTYLRRYTLQAVCGLASDDDDGNSLAVANKPVQMDKDLHDGHLDMLDNAKTLKELEVFYKNAVIDARKAKDTLAEQEFTATKNMVKKTLEQAVPA
jgi:ERF superfamily